MENKLNLHFLIKFWARKEPKYLFQIINGSKLVVDPFCGSGSTGYCAVFKSISALLSDINPVSVFITYNSLNKETLKKDIIDDLREICKEIEREAYTLSNGKQIHFALWKGNDVIALKFTDGTRTTKKELIKEYVEFEEKINISHWYPNGNFCYPNTDIEFKDGPHRLITIKELFTKRNLFVVSKIYSYIEKIWKEDNAQGDLLKFAFIASLVNATKMIPHAQSSGPSWKVPRYWIPNLREERNFCKTFLRRITLLCSFKNDWKRIVSNYQITLSYDGEVIIPKEKSIHICRMNALNICNELPRLDLVILDPPHYDEIQYFELHYLWQKWLEGYYCDSRFRDYDYWSEELSVNKKIGRNLEWYNSRLQELILNYSKYLSNKGRIFLILHNKNKKILEKTIEGIKKYVGGSFELKTYYERQSIPSTTQGLHGRKKYLCILKIKRVN